MSLFLQNCSVFLTLLCDVRLMILASFVIIDWLDSYSLVALASRQRLLIEAAPHLSFLKFAYDQQSSGSLLSSCSAYANGTQQGIFCENFPSLCQFFFANKQGHSAMGNFNKKTNPTKFTLLLHVQLLASLTILHITIYICPTTCIFLLRILWSS